MIRTRLLALISRVCPAEQRLSTWVGGQSACGNAAESGTGKDEEEFGAVEKMGQTVSRTATGVEHGSAALICDAFPALVMAS